MVRIPAYKTIARVEKGEVLTATKVQEMWDKHISDCVIKINRALDEEIIKRAIDSYQPTASKGASKMATKRKPRTPYEKLKEKYQIETNELRLRIESLEDDNKRAVRDTRLAEENYEKQVNKTCNLQNFLEVILSELSGVLETLPGIKQEDEQTPDSIRKERELLLLAAGYERSQRDGSYNLVVPHCITGERHAVIENPAKVSIKRPVEETMESHARRFGRIEGVVRGLMGRIESALPKSQMFPLPKSQMFPF